MYKYEEVVWCGVIGVLIVYDMFGVGYGWSMVIVLVGENYDIVW